MDVLQIPQSAQHFTLSVILNVFFFFAKTNKQNYFPFISVRADGDQTDLKYEVQA